MNAIIFGASGQVGSSLLREILQSSSFINITSIGRREISYNGPNSEKLSQIIIDFNNLDKHISDLSNIAKKVDIIFNAFGTTLSKSGSKENFILIDRDFVLNSAKFIYDHSNSQNIHFIYCSASNSNLNSFFLYPRTKGQIEKGLLEIGFNQLSILQPGLLLIDGQRSDSRILESFARKITPMIDFGGHFSIHVNDVAKTMRKIGEGYELQNPITSDAGTKVYRVDNKTIRFIAQEN